MDHISTLGGECIVAREDHADGGTHLHVFCDFGRKFRSRKADVFDVDDHHQTLCLLVAHQKRVTTTQSRMATLSAEALADQRPAELEIARLILNGLRLRVLRIENSFGNLFTAWIQKVQLALSRNSPNTVTGSSLFMLPNIHRQPELNSLMEGLMDDLIGYNNLAWEVDNHT